MRIAQVAPLFESVPPKLYGGTERVVSYLTEELVRLGHDVTLFASGDSETAARLIAPCKRALRLDTSCKDQLVHQLLELEQVAGQASRSDVIHYHVDCLHLPLARRLNVPHVTTLHGSLEGPDLVPFYREFDEVPLISISDSQRVPLPFVNWQKTIHHGLPAGLHHFRPQPGAYLAFLGRISPEKRPDRAIEIARRVGLPLKIAAKVDSKDAEYFKRVIEPLLDGASVEFIGEIGGDAKDTFLGEAYALLFPIDWSEPFGLVMIEALACGTPVIAWRHGSVPEVIEEGMTGFVVDSIDAAVDAVKRVPEIDRRKCRASFDQRFVSGRMARDYLKAYERVRRQHRYLSRNGKSTGVDAVLQAEATE